jgi:hypothetical protein
MPNPWKAPEWFYHLSPLEMDPMKGPDDQYMFGARDMLTVLQRHPDLLEAYEELRDENARLRAQNALLIGRELIMNPSKVER